MGCADESDQPITSDNACGGIVLTITIKCKVPVQSKSDIPVFYNIDFSSP
jgi:hypothetical protein